MEQQLRELIKKYEEYKNQSDGDEEDDYSTGYIAGEEELAKKIVSDLEALLNTTTKNS